jgi:hypothetical protein
MKILTLPDFCACPWPGHGFSMPRCVIFCVQWFEMVQLFVFIDIGEIVDHHYLNSLLKN